MRSYLNLLNIVCVTAFIGRQMRIPRSATIKMGIRSAIKDFFTRRFKKERSDDELKKGIGKFYDETSGIWLDVWGEHMHHGYYPTPDYKNHTAAQIDMIDRSIDWAYGSSKPNKIKSMVLFLESEFDIIVLI